MSMSSEIDRKTQAMTATERRAMLFERAGRLPLEPGVYLMKNAAGQIIYVGKSRALRNRVSSYFAPSAKHNLKTQHMVEAVFDFDFMLTDTEIGALALENSLIKLHSPKFNIRLKDGKSYPYIRVSMQDAWPRITVTRKRLADHAKYFGPYTGMETAYTLLRTAQKMFGVACCKKEFPRDIGKGRPCLYWQIGQCCAPCSGRISQEEYRAVFADVLTFLRGSVGDVRKSFTEKMQQAAENLQFEAAAHYRDKLASLEHLWQKQQVVGSPDTELDVLGLYTGEDCSAISIFFVRSGYVTDQICHLFAPEQLTDSSDLCAFLCRLYMDREYIPHELLLGFPLEPSDKDLLESYLTELAGYRVHLRFPERGDNRALCALAEQNAREKALQDRKDRERDGRTLIALAKALRLEVVPERIEMYDISHMGGTHTTAGMIVSMEGKLMRSEYRSWTIHCTAEGDREQDDYAAMLEALQRRLQNDHLPLPDLILLDGGRGHVSVIRGLLEELQMDLPIFGLVKDEHHRTRALTTENREIEIARNPQLYPFLYKLQEEVHRYTVSRMETAARKTMRRSSLEDIPGIGPEKAKRLLSHFGKLQALREASQEALEQVPGISLRNAQAVWQHFHGGMEPSNPHQTLT